jgi:hypothetical protein
LLANFTFAEIGSQDLLQWGTLTSLSEALKGGGWGGVCIELIEEMCHLLPPYKKGCKNILAFACIKGVQKMQKAFFPTPFD